MSGLQVKPGAGVPPATSAPARHPSRDGRIRASVPLPLALGGSVQTWDIGYRLFGDPRLPLVVALGGISASRDVTGVRDGEPGWWSSQVGPDRAIDTRRFCVLGMDYLGGSGATSGPDALAVRPGYPPAVTTRDQAAVLAILLDYLGIARAHAVVGASYGAMVALAFAAHHGHRLERAVVISGAHEPHPMATALRSLQRQIVRFGLAHGDADDALVMARALAMTTYRSAAEFARRFDNTGTASPSGYRFPVDDYLEHCGRSFLARFRPAAFLCLSESIDLHRVEPESIRDVAVTVVGAEPDPLVPWRQVRALRRRLRAPATLHRIRSIYGHDAFLKEGAAVSRILNRSLTTVEAR